MSQHERTVTVFASYVLGGYRQMGTLSDEELVAAVRRGLDLSPVGEVTIRIGEHDRADECDGLVESLRDALATAQREREEASLHAYRQARIFEHSMEGYHAAMSVYAAAFGKPDGEPTVILPDGTEKQGWEVDGNTYTAAESHLETVRAALAQIVEEMDTAVKIHETPHTRGFLSSDAREDVQHWRDRLAQLGEGQKDRPEPITPSESDRPEPIRVALSRLLDNLYGLHYRPGHLDAVIDVINLYAPIKVKTRGEAVSGEGGANG